MIDPIILGFCKVVSHSRSVLLYFNLFAFSASHFISPHWSACMYISKYLLIVSAFQRSELFSERIHSHHTYADNKNLFKSFKICGNFHTHAHTRTPSRRNTFLQWESLSYRIGWNPTNISITINNKIRLIIWVDLRFILISMGAHIVNYCCWRKHQCTYMYMYASPWFNKFKCKIPLIYTKC